MSITDAEPCGHAEHPGKFINDWTDKERGAFLLGQKMAHEQREDMLRHVVNVAREVDRITGHGYGNLVDALARLDDLERS